MGTHDYQFLALGAAVKICRLCEQHSGLWGGVKSASYQVLNPKNVHRTRCQKHGDCNNAQAQVPCCARSKQKLLAWMIRSPGLWTRACGTASPLHFSCVIIYTDVSMYCANSCEAVRSDAFFLQSLVSLIPFRSCCGAYAYWSPQARREECALCGYSEEGGLASQSGAETFTCH